MHKLIKRAKNQKGFTLVELMVVVIIIGILVAIAVPVYNGVQANARKNAHNANVRTLEGAAALYISENGVDGKIKLTNDDLVPKYLQAWPTNPMKNGEAYKIGLGTDGKITVSPARETVED
ncbi:MAG TPA: prepilin-type N-terminal cleavage/methylation domain-containing protein [Oscillospiraceae bacterium]|nr:prepilin-type N-terminal cleavage/methylation domain-containing protein [Oscillospiraceae bacterium]